MVTVKQIVRKSDDIYARLYKNANAPMVDNIIRMGCDYYDAMVRKAKFIDTIRECVKERGDYYTSDREVASLMLAFSYYRVTF